MSIEFIFRILGMIIFGAGGVVLGANMSELAEGPVELWASVIGLIGVLIGLVLTPYITLHPIRAIRDKLGQITARTLFSGIFGGYLIVVSGRHCYPIFSSVQTAAEAGSEYHCCYSQDQSLLLHSENNGITYKYLFLI